jgi:hypothetical protein
MPGPDNEDMSPVALGEDGPGSTGFGEEPKSGCHSFAGGYACGDRGAGGVKAGACCIGGGAGDGVEGAALKNWVKLPSAEAESETPGAENPFIREGLAGGGVNCRGSATVLAELPGDRGSVGGTEVFTKMRVNSPGAGLADELDGLGAGCDSGLMTGF